MAPRTKQCRPDDRIPASILRKSTSASLYGAGIVQTSLQKANAISVHGFESYWPEPSLTLVRYILESMYCMRCAAGCQKGIRRQTHVRRSEKQALMSRPECIRSLNASKIAECSCLVEYKTKEHANGSCPSDYQWKG